MEPRIVLSASPFSLDGDALADAAVAAAVAQPYVQGDVIVALGGVNDVGQLATLSTAIAWPAAFTPSVFDTAEHLLSLADNAHGDVALVHFSLGSEVDSLALIEQLEPLGGVAWAAPNYIYEQQLEFVPNDPGVVGQYQHALMQNFDAWDITVGDPSVVVAVTDTGVDWDHEDLANNIWSNTDEIAGNGIDDDSNGFIDDIRGWDFASNDNNPDESGGSDHGTHVSGIIAAEINNGVGVAGTAGGATIMPLRISGSPTSAIYSGAYRYAADNGAKIVNTSFNVDGRVGDPTYESALQYLYDAGALHFNSAGNNGQLNPPRQALHQSLFVANTNNVDVKSGSSNYGTGIDVSAPGSSIFSLEPNDTYDFKSGTSMAAPHAAAVAALIWSANPSLTRDQVAAQLLGTTDDISAQNPGLDGLIGTGRVNSFRALTDTIAAPRIDDVSELPSEGGTLFSELFTITVELGSIFDETTIEDAQNWQLTWAGPDDDLGTTGDNELIPLVPAIDYLIGTNDMILAVGASMNNGLYEFRAVSGGLVDPFGTALDGDGNGTAGDDYVRTFTLNAIPPPDILINEADPGANDYVELYNAESFAVDLTNYQFIAKTSGGTTTTFTLPSFTLNPGAYVVLHETSGTNTATDLFFNSNISWTSTGGGSGALVNTTGVGIDFFRWGGSSELPPAGTGWIPGTDPPSYSGSQVLGRDSISTDTDQGADWTIQDASPGGPNGIVIPPTIDAGGPYSAFEGQDVSLNATVQNPQPGDTYSWDLNNDGTFGDATGLTPLVTWSTLVSLGIDDGPSSFTATVRGTTTSSTTYEDTTSLTINNLAPWPTANGAGVSVPGAPYTLTLEAADQSPADQAAGFTFLLDFDNNGTYDDTVVGASGTEYQHTFASLGNHTIRVEAVDKDGGGGVLDLHSVDVVSLTLQANAQTGLTDLLYGGTDLLDGVFFYGNPSSVIAFTQIEGLALVERFDAFGAAVTGKIVVYGNGGDDVLGAEFLDGVSVEIHGGPGNDVIVGGTAGDLLFGDDGHDLLLGGDRFVDGDDTIHGGAGNDVLFGYFGADQLFGEAGEDLLVGDQFNFTNPSQGFLRIHQEWISAKPYATRVNNILFGGGLNDPYTLTPGVTAIDDGQVDTLVGDAGDLDWFFYAFGQDLASDVEAGEEETDSVI